MVLRKLNKSLAAVKTMVRKRRLGSDYERWAQTQSLSEKWDTRTARIAELVPSGSNVLEFGAGRLVLKEHLPADCVYTPSDIVDRGEGTIVCDLNDAELPNFAGAYDTAVFSGVLEYVNDVPRLITALAADVPTIVTSYATLERNAKIAKRRKSGWVNDYPAQEFVSIFTSRGYVVDHSEVWHSQEIFRLVQSEKTEARL